MGAKRLKRILFFKILLWQFFFFTNTHVLLATDKSTPPDKNQILEKIQGQLSITSQIEHTTLKNHLTQKYSDLPDDATELFNLAFKSKEKSEAQFLRILSHSRFTKINTQRVTSAKGLKQPFIEYLLEKETGIVLYFLSPTVANGGFGNVKQAIMLRGNKKRCAKGLNIEHYDALQEEAKLTNYMSSLTEAPPRILLQYNKNDKFEYLYLISKWLCSDLYYLSEKFPSTRTRRPLRTILHDSLSYLKKLKKLKLVHKDIKPDNMMWSESGLTFIDYGLSYFPEESEGYSLSGTRSYSAPESLLGYNHYEKDRNLTQLEQLNGDIFSLALALVAPILPNWDAFPRSRARNKNVRQQHYRANYYGYMSFYEKLEKEKKGEAPTTLEIESLLLENEEQQFRRPFAIMSKKLKGGPQNRLRKDLFPIFWKMLDPNPNRRVTPERALNELGEILGSHSHKKERKYITNLALKDQKKRIIYNYKGLTLTTEKNVD